MGNCYFLLKKYQSQNSYRFRNSCPIELKLLPVHQKFNLESENVVERRKPITESRDNAVFVRCWQSPGYPGPRPLRVNMQHFEFSVARQCTFLHENG